MLGDEAWTKRGEEEEQRRMAIAEEQWNRGAALEKLLKKAETDIEASRLVELARLIDPASFQSRETHFADVRRMRMSPQGNDPNYQDAIDAHERVARLAIEYAVEKAEAVLGLVRSWG